MKSADLTVRISILSEDATTGTLQWEETHSVTTNEFGVFTLKIGIGEQTGGSASAFSDIQWGSASHFLKVGVNDGSGYVDMGTTQLLSVPYAMYSEYAASSSSSVESSWVDGVGKVPVVASSDNMLILTVRSADFISSPALSQATAW